MNISNSNAMRLVALLPFGYYLATRLRSLRDIAYLVVTSWIPVLWIGWEGTSLPFANVLRWFALGYLAFISLYEIGYFANDHWDARRHEDGRDRRIAKVGAAWLAVFVVVRIGCWAAIAALTGWWTNLLWLWGYVALIAVFTAHNVVANPSLRLATFSQLALLRYMLPLAAVANTTTLAALFAAGVFTYVPLRFLAYADSKGLITIPERKQWWFAASYLLLTVPLLGLAAMAMDRLSILGVGIMLAIAHWAWGLFSDHPNGAKR